MSETESGLQVALCNAPETIAQLDATESGLQLALCDDFGLEVAPCNAPEVIAQPDANKYIINAEQPEKYPFDPPIQSAISDARSRDWKKAFWVLALVAVLCLALALGAGLGAGLAAQHRSSSPSALATSSLPASSSIASSTANTTTQYGRVVTMISVPSTPPTLTSIPSTTPTHTFTSIPSTAPTFQSPVSPADYSSTNIATNEPSPTANPPLVIASTSQAPATMSTGVTAYSNNCEGSSLTPSVTDCNSALSNINTGATYDDGAQFSVGNCYMVYATNGAGPESLSGQTIRDTAQYILSSCSGGKGSFGTINCGSCHVTVNYRSS